LKCLDEIWRTRKKYRATLEGKGVSKGFSVGFDKGLTNVDQRESLGFVSDVFEVMAQVDHSLTKVNTVDLLIRVNNSG
jgi:hypothetical protein